MTVSYDRNYVGTIIFVVFLMFTTSKIIYEAALYVKTGDGALWWFELLVLVPVGVACFGGMLWMLFDPEWLNLEDEEKDDKLATTRWVKFSPLLLLTLLLVAKTCLTGGNLLQQAIIDCVFDSIVLLCAYVSLCVAHDRGFGRLFQPFAVLRTKEYIDEKGQKFGPNIIGTTMNILCLGASSWFVFIREQIVKLVGMIIKSETNVYKYLVHSITSLLVFCTMTVMFCSCVRVTFFLSKDRWNYLKFSPVLLAPMAVLCTEVLFCDTLYGWRHKVMMVMYAFVSVLAYMSLLSPPDTLFAVLFQPYIALVDLAQDIPSPPQPAKPHFKMNVVLPKSPESK